MPYKPTHRFVNSLTKGTFERSTSAAGDSKRKKGLSRKCEGPNAFRNVFAKKAAESLRPKVIHRAEQGKWFFVAKVGTNDGWIDGCRGTRGPGRFAHEPILSAAGPTCPCVHPVGSLTSPRPPSHAPAHRVRSG